MTTVLDVVVGDTDVVISGLLSGAKIGTLTDLSGFSLAFSLIPVNGSVAVVDDASATLGALDTVNKTIAVSYAVQAGDLSTAGLFRVRWTLTAGPGKITHFPAPRDEQTLIRVNP